MRPTAPHPTHKMSKWKHGVVVIIAEPRFGRWRECTRCGLGQSEAVSGRRDDDGIFRPCSAKPLTAEEEEEIRARHMDLECNEDRVWATLDAARAENAELRAKLAEAERERDRLTAIFDKYNDARLDLAADAASWEQQCEMARELALDLGRRLDEAVAALKRGE